MGWEPIGTEFGGSDFYRFLGTFDGNGHKILNLTINRPDLTGGPIGLFGSIGNGTVIENVGLENVKVTGGFHVGSLAGQNNGGTIAGCSSTSMAI